MEHRVETETLPADRVGRGLCSVWRRQARMVHGGAAHESDGVLVALTNLPDASLNVALIEREPEDPVSALAWAASMFQRSGLSLGIDLERGRFLGVEATARTRGLRPVAARPGMARPLDGFEPGPIPRDVTVERVVDPAGLAELVGIQVEAFNWRRAVAERFLPESVLEVTGLRLYLARLDGVAVASALAHLDDGSAGIFGVATLRWARRRGIATAITGRAMAEAAEEADLAWLLATTDGRLVYERMGFRGVGEWVVWVA